jgi:hypothetical protein
MLIASTSPCSAAPPKTWGPFTIPQNTNWTVGGHYDTVRARGLPYTLTATNQPPTQVVFFNKTTANHTAQQHRDYFKSFLENIRTTFPNASLTYARILDDKIPFVRVYDLSGETLFWGSLHYSQTSYDIGITTRDRAEQLPIEVIELLSTLTVIPKRTLNEPAPD